MIGLAVDTFRKSTFSGPDGCVEAGLFGDRVVLADSKNNGQAPTLAFTPDEWKAFLQGVKAGEFDL